MKVTCSHDNERQAERRANLADEHEMQRANEGRCIIILQCNKQQKSE